MEATIGPDSWKYSTINNIKLAQNVMQRSDTFNDLGKQLDSLPSLRDSCVHQSNAQIHEYVRDTRDVVANLQEYLRDTEEEITFLLRGKERLEKSLEHIRKDIILNEQCNAGRKEKPLREKEKDGADNLIESEKRQLLKIKRVLESQLRSVQKQLQVLDNSRKRLKSVLSERRRVLDLICHANPPVRTPSRNKQEFSSKKELCVNPIGPFTPEAAKSITAATDAIKSSRVLTKEVTVVIDEINTIQKSIHFSVNNGLTKKIAESVAMRQHLQLASGENKMALYRGNRWHYSTELARGYTLGPVSSSDLTTRERLDRPAVRIYQRHPGTQLNEAERIIDGDYSLEASLNALDRNIGMLRITQQRLEDDARDKHIGAKVDAGIVRHRRKKANHRWVVGGLTC